MTKTKTNKTTKAKVTESAPKKAQYHLEVVVNDVVFKTTADSMAEALAKFVKSPEFPVGAKTKAFLKYGKGGLTRTRLFHTNEARRVLLTIAHKLTALDVLAEQLNRSIEQ